MLFIKLSRALLAGAAFLLILLGVYGLHIQLFKVDVVFYAALADVGLAVALMVPWLFGWRGFRVFCHFERVQLLLIMLLAGYALAISVPTVIDRSLSFYILEKLQQRGGAIRYAAFEQVFSQEYLKEHRLVDVRLTEQIESGTLRVDQGCVRLTEKGEALARFSRYFRRHWLPKQRQLMGQYSDDLTDPFRHSAPAPGYACDER